MPKTHWKKLSNPDYLGAYSIEDGRDLILTIQNVRQEQVTGADGKKEECIVAHFAEPVKPMILNATNCKMIAKLLKTSYIEDWAGHRVQIGAEKVKAFGEIVEALRVRSKLPSGNEEKITCEGCANEITMAHGMTPKQLAEYTKKKYGFVLCANCAALAKANKAEKKSAEQESMPEAAPDNNSDKLDEVTTDEAETD